ncbi:hypothetical protein [Peptoniphilus obesi]|uniref:hypothetical protein n=1 Tax=Peptoniphilus obesi TaxID=1472765 RepID=UPI0004B38582|nr:hypothetical protein [Peptoniphilus obesi]
MQIINKIKELSKREKILLMILSFLIFELIFYSLLISPFIKKLNNVKFKNKEIQSQINLNKESYKKALSMKEDNKKLLNSDLSSNFNILSDENLTKFQGDDISLLDKSENENNKSIEFKTSKDGLNSISRFNEFFIFNDMEISKEVEDEYLFKANLLLNKNSNLPIIVASDGKDLNLKDSYYKDKQKLNQNKSEDDKKIKSIKKEIKKSKNKTATSPKKQDKLKVEKSIKKDFDKEVVENIQKADVYKTDSLIPDFKFLKFDINNFATYAGEGNEISLIQMEDFLVVDYEITNIENDDYLYIFFNDVVDVKNFKLLIELPYNFTGEIGYLDAYKNPFELSPEFGGQQLVEIDEIKALKGLYYKPEEENISGYFIIKAIEAEI